MSEERSPIAHLYELQQTDTAIAAHRKTLRGLDDGAGADADLAAARETLASLTEQHRSLEGSLLDRELRLKGAEQERKDRSGQAYGGTISDPKQLAALEKKIDELGRLKGKLEEETLDLMDQLEQSEARVAAQEETVQEAEARANSIKERYASETRRIKGELKGLMAQREEVVAHVDDSLLKQYESLLPKTGGLAVAAVRQGSCQGCHVSLPSTYAPRLQAHRELIRCENCRRILFLPPGESPFVPQEDR